MGVDEQGQPIAECMDDLGHYKRLIFKKLGNIWRDYKYHLYCQFIECETIEEIE